LVLVPLSLALPASLVPPSLKSGPGDDESEAGDGDEANRLAALVDDEVADDEEVFLDFLADDADDDEDDDFLAFLRPPGDLSRAGRGTSRMLSWRPVVGSAVLGSLGLCEVW
jgi:hypothetical protein